VSSTVALILLFTSFIVTGHILLPRVLRYRLTEDGVEMVLCGFFPMFYLPYEDIEDAHKASATEVIFSTKVINRVWGQFVILSRKTGLRRAILVSPDDVESFLRELRERSYIKQGYISS